MLRRPITTAERVHRAHDGTDISNASVTTFVKKSVIAREGRSRSMIAVEAAAGDGPTKAQTAGVY